MLWQNTWSYCQQDYRSWPSKIEKDHQKISIRMTQSGKAIRLRFSNQFGDEVIRFEKVSIGERGTRKRLVRVNDCEVIEIFPGCQLLSDPIEITYQIGDVLIIETHLNTPTILKGGIVTYSKSVSLVENIVDERQISQTELFRMVTENPRMQFIYGISGIDIQSDNKNIVFFGDSLTQQGYIVDQLKLAAISQGLECSIINRGIGGSRILKGTDSSFDSYERHGVAGLQRFENDCFSQGKPASIVVFHGVNDLITSEDGDHQIVDEVIFGLKQYVALAHFHSTKIYVATLLPFGNSEFFSDEREKFRTKINRWICGNRVFDGYLDFSKAVADDSNPQYLNSDFDSGDGLHLSEKGGKQIVNSFQINQLLESYTE